MVFLECHEEKIVCKTPSRYQWMSFDRVSVFHTDKSALEAIHIELKHLKEGTEPEFRVSWGLLGWFMETTSWVEKDIGAHGLKLKDSPAQARVSTYSILNVVYNFSMKPP